MRVIRAVQARLGAALLLLASLLAAVATVGVVAGWYGTGVPNHLPSAEPFGVGAALPKTARLLPLRFPDPNGGPPWGLRIVRTQFGSCQQIGRVENGQLGTLGIDGYWRDDHRFHPLSTSWVGGQCGTSGSVGIDDGRIDASGSAPGGDSGSPTAGCTLIPSVTSSQVANSGSASLAQSYCPAGSQRVFISGQLRGSVRSITYRKPDGTTATEQTAGTHGSFLLVFDLDTRSCSFYFHGKLTQYGCGPVTSRSQKPTKPSSPVTRAIKDIQLLDGETCPVEAPALFSYCPTSGAGKSSGS